jgi:hypothetical protein
VGKEEPIASLCLRSDVSLQIAVCRGQRWCAYRTTTDDESAGCATWQIPSRSKYCCFLKRWSVSPPGNSEAATISAAQVQYVRVRGMRVAVGS